MLAKHLLGTKRVFPNIWAFYKSPKKVVRSIVSIISKEFWKNTSKIWNQLRCVPKCWRTPSWRQEDVFRSFEHFYKTLRKPWEALDVISKEIWKKIVKFGINFNVSKNVGKQSLATRRVYFKVFSNFQKPIEGFGALVLKNFENIIKFGANFNVPQMLENLLAPRGFF